MMGPDEITPETAGLIPRITQHIFETISNTLENIEFMIKVSMVEIYMEKIKVREDVSLGSAMSSEW